MEVPVQNIPLSDFVDNEDNEIELGDGLEQVNKTYDTIEFDTLLLQILHTLDDREKVIFLFQVLRGSGYNIAHEPFQKTMHISKKTYVRVLKCVKDKISCITNHKSI